MIKLDFRDAAQQHPDFLGRLFFCLAAKFGHLLARNSRIVVPLRGTLNDSSPVWI